ncbi:MAG TPA: hypothetical protein VFK70_02445 [Vicinamibacteria bacterium]|nr:hypothetical protein [Vicinamibacteria bacterium]
MPGREPICHCGLERIRAFPAGRSVPPALAASRKDNRPRAVLVTVLAAAAVGVALFGAVRRLDERADAGAQAPSPLARGAAIYPALPVIRAAPARTAAREGAAPTTLTAVPRRPATAAEVDWDRATALLDLPLRRIEAEASVLEVDYRAFAGPCLTPGPPSATSGAWLASLKTVPVIGGVTLREKGATIDCETARRRLVGRADRLKSDIDEQERLGRTNGVRPEHWRQLLALHGLEAWPSY